MVGDKQALSLLRALNRERDGAWSRAEIQGASGRVGLIVLDAFADEKAAHTLMRDVVFVLGAINLVLSMGRAIDDGLNIE